MAQTMAAVAELGKQVHEASLVERMRAIVIGRGYASKVDPNVREEAVNQIVGDNIAILKRAQTAERNYSRYLPKVGIDEMDPNYAAVLWNEGYLSNPSGGFGYQSTKLTDQLLAEHRGLS